jgi:transcriptional regulator with XRE-family HTH domain
MAQFPESADVLVSWGERLRRARLDRNDTMRVFGQRLGVSESTVRDMERGAPTVQIGTWMNAFAVLDRIADVEGALEPRESLIDRARLASPRARARPRRARP